MRKERFWLDQRHLLLRLNIGKSNQIELNLEGKWKIEFKVFKRLANSIYCRFVAFISLEISKVFPLIGSEEFEDGSCH
ncbi:hypothetical protein BLOT_005993 [Blomia tropicalis]|nr:hypothetical protein BLOT_005993 [Blomia tropicalis]